MHIRTAALADFPLLYLFWKNSVWVYPFQEEKQRYDAMLSLHPDLCFILEDGHNQIIGSILGAFDGRTVSIHRLVITKHLQRHGYGKLLFETLEKAARKKGIQKIVGQVHKSNIQVLGFYKKMGFEEDNVITLKKTVQKFPQRVISGTGEI